MAKQSGDRTHSHAFLETTCELALEGQGTGSVLLSPERPQAFCRAVLSHREEGCGWHRKVEQGLSSVAAPTLSLARSPVHSLGPLVAPGLAPCQSWLCPPAVHASLVKAKGRVG